MNWFSFVLIGRINLLTLLFLFQLLALAGEIYITTTVINVRTGPGTNYEISFILQKGEKVEVLSKSNSWLQIKYKGKTGYAHISNLQFSRDTMDNNLDKAQEIVSKLLIGAYVCLGLFVGVIVFIKIRDRKLLKTVTGLDRGTKTERELVLQLLKFGIPAQDIFHDLYLEKGIKEYVQIDLVVLTKVGVVVFEVKNFGGWLFGKGYEDQWTQVLAYGKRKYRIYNPIMQNKRHIVELKKQLVPLGNIPFYSCVVFFGNCVLKEINFVPSGTFLVKANRVKEVLKIILKDNLPVYYNDRMEVVHALQKARVNGSIKEVQKQHVENIKDMIGKHRIFD